MTGTIDYYNRNADQYYWNTVAVDFDALRKKFASYLPAEARVMDLGCGSGRDVMAFGDMGFVAEGLDLSSELVKLARERLGINVEEGDMSDWKAASPYDGIWCCASLIHLNDEEKDSFFSNLERNLKDGGILYISAKDGIETGIDELGRYVSNCPESELRERLENAGCEILDVTKTQDTLGRPDCKWLNVIARKKKSAA